MENESTRDLARRESAADGRVHYDHKDAVAATLLRSSSRHNDTALGRRIKDRLSWHRQSLPPSFFQSADFSLDASTHLLEAPAPAEQQQQQNQQNQQNQRQTAPSSSRRRSILFGHGRRPSQAPEATESLASSQLQPLISSHTGRQPHNSCRPATAVTLADPATQFGVPQRAGVQAHPAHPAGNTTADAVRMPTADRHTTAAASSSRASPQPGMFGRLLHRASNLRLRSPRPAKNPSGSANVADSRERPSQEAPDNSHGEQTPARFSAQEQRTNPPTQSLSPPIRPVTASAAEALQAAAATMPPAPLRRKPSLMDRLRLRSSSTPTPQEQQQPVKRTAYVPTHAASDFSRLDPRVREGYQFYSRSSSNRHSRTLHSSAAHDQLSSELRRLASISSDITEEEPNGDHLHVAAPLPPAAAQPSQNRHQQIHQQRKSHALRVDPHEKQNASPRDSKGPFSTSPVLESKPDETLPSAGRADGIHTHGDNYAINSSAMPTTISDGKNKGVTPHEAQSAEDQNGEQQASQLTDYEIFVRRAAEKEEQELRRRRLAAQGVLGRVPAPQLPPPNPFYWHPTPPPPRLGGIEEDQGTNSNSSAGGTTAVNPRSSRSRSQRDSGQSYSLAPGGPVFQQQQQQQQPWQRHAKRQSWTSAAGRGGSIEEGLVGSRDATTAPAVQPRALRHKPSITQRIAEYVRPSREWDEVALRQPGRL